MGVSEGAGCAQPPGARSLSEEDLAILALESDVVVGHTCKVMLLEGPVDAEALRRSIAARLGDAPELGLRLGEVDRVPTWVPATEVRMHEQVVENASGELAREGLQREVSRIFEQRLDRSKPLWRIDLLPSLRGGGSALVWRIHHALADGTTAMRIGRAAVWNEPEGTASVDGRRVAARAAQGHSATLRALIHEAPHPWRRSPFAGAIDKGRAVAFAHADLEALHRAASITCSATVNDAVLTVVSGAVRRWLESHHCRQGAVRVKVPVSLHGAHTDHGRGELDPGNRDSYFCLDLPLGPEDPVKRLKTIHQATRERKLDHDAERLDHLMHALGQASPRLQRFAEQIAAGPRSFALNVSNVPGPRQPIDVLGTRVGGLYSIAEIGERHALRIAVVSLAGTLGFGLCADPNVLPDVEHLAAAIQQEAEALADVVALV